MEELKAPSSSTKLWTVLPWRISTLMMAMRISTQFHLPPPVYNQCAAYTPSPPWTKRPPPPVSNQSAVWTKRSVASTPSSPASTTSPRGRKNSDEMVGGGGGGARRKGDVERAGEMCGWEQFGRVKGV
ncbi:Os10g0116250 [Oryza sativa Japonica Group]|uniref:Os10g0116250 protein n=1 Tax=Oryza sativa subsp. japonica TaxID=39947 RepID=A0A0P0XRN5_ORYSJ|nr:Os10g0116250 [Oryza sativa Japonica Group]